MAEEKISGRISFISFLQFVGVLSVIFGHSMNSIPVPKLFTDIKAWVYSYHMPLFFFVSAFLFSYKGGYKQGYKAVLLKRFMRLMVPYLLWNTLFIIPKVIFKDYIDDEVVFSAGYFVRIILRPRDNILGHTWFLCALFEMFIIAVAFEKAKNHKELWVPVLLALTILNCFGIENRWLAIGDLMKNGIFFWLGMLLGTYSPEKINLYLKNKSIIIAILLLCVVTSMIWYFNRTMTINTLVLGLSIIVGLLILQVNLRISSDLIEFISSNSFSIYIMHWPVRMVLRLVFYQKMGIPAVTAQIINLVMGFIIPCYITYLIKKFKTPWIRKICTIVFGI